MNSIALANNHRHHPLLQQLNTLNTGSQFGLRIIKIKISREHAPPPWTHSPLHSPQQGSDLLVCFLNFSLSPCYQGTPDRLTALGVISTPPSTHDPQPLLVLAPQKCMIDPHGAIRTIATYKKGLFFIVTASRMVPYTSCHCRWVDKSRLFQTLGIGSESDNLIEQVKHNKGSSGVLTEGRVDRSEFIFAGLYKEHVIALWTPATVGLPFPGSLVNTHDTNDTLTCSTLAVPDILFQ